MRLNKLTLKDKKLFRQYLNLSRHGLSVYAFQNIYIWKRLFKIYWVLIENNLCVFFKDKIGCFMYLPPLTKRVNPLVIRECFRIMDGFNQNQDISRIENLEIQDLSFYQGLGYECRHKSDDYLCQRSDLVRLKGNKFKSKRACYNYFVKNYKFRYLPFTLKYKKDCLQLYNSWMKERKNQNPDPIYKSMLEDSRTCFKILLDDYADLDILVRLVRIEQDLKAFTLGFKLNKDTFCILYEIADLSVKGLSQFIFRKFCSELKEYRFINIMDDSGLENLKKTKLSYHPIRLIPAYIAKRKNG